MTEMLLIFLEEDPRWIEAVEADDDADTRSDGIIATGTVSANVEKPPVKDVDCHKQELEGFTHICCAMGETAHNASCKRKKRVRAVRPAIRIKGH